MCSTASAYGLARHDRPSIWTHYLSSQRYKNRFIWPIDLGSWVESWRYYFVNMVYSLFFMEAARFSLCTGGSVPTADTCREGLTLSKSWPRCACRIFGGRSSESWKPLLIIHLLLHLLLFEFILWAVWHFHVSEPSRGILSLGPGFEESCQILGKLGHECNEKKHCGTVTWF